jgi:hypothetical protein
MGSDPSILSKFESGGCLPTHVRTLVIECEIHDSPLSRYLEGLAYACLEAAHGRRLVGTLIGVLKLAPRTITEMLVDEFFAERN